MKRLAIVSTHPIQYNYPIFKLLTQRNKIKIKVFYTWENSKNGVYDIDFKKKIKWKLPLLEAYDFTFVKNTSKQQGSHHHHGIINPFLIEDIESWQANSILVYGWNFNSHLKIIKHFKKKKIPVILRGDSTLLVKQSIGKKLIKKLFLTWLFRHIDFGLSIGKENKKYYLNYGLKENQIYHTPCTIDNIKLSENPKNRLEQTEKIKQDLSIKPNDVIFLYIGKFISIKCPLLLIEAIKKINKENFKFLFVGRGELESKMKESAKDVKEIIILPFQNQDTIAAYYELGDVFVFPSKKDNWGLVVNEAMVFNNAVLVSDKAGCCADLVKDGVNGYSFESENLDDLTKKLTLFNKKNATTMGIASNKIIKKYNSQTKVCESIEYVVNTHS